MGVIPGNSELLVLFKTGGVIIRERVYSNSSGSKSRSLRNTLNQTYYQSTWNQLRENETYVVIAHPKHIVGSRRLVFVLLLVFNLLFSCVLNKTTPCPFKPATGVPQVWDKLQRWELCPFIFPHFYEPMSHPTASVHRKSDFPVSKELGGDDTTPHHQKSCRIWQKKDYSEAWITHFFSMYSYFNF